MTKQAKTVLLINGPNLDLLGIRQPEIYGTTTLDQIVQQLTERSKSCKIEVESFQSNSEGEIITRLGDHFRKSEDRSQCIAGIIINPAGLSHTSVALRDALEMFRPKNIPIVEVHLSNIYRREEFRRTSLTAPAANALVTGMGAFGYIAALDYILNQ